MLDFIQVGGAEEREEPLIKASGRADGCVLLAAGPGEPSAQRGTPVSGGGGFGFLSINLHLRRWAGNSAGEL
jgi:hypothetical protein